MNYNQCGTIPMAVTDIDTLEKWYSDSCQRHGVFINKAISVALFKAKFMKARHEPTVLEVFLDDLWDADFYPLFDLLVNIDNSEIDAVDVIHRSCCAMSVEYVFPLLRAVNNKLRLVDLQDVKLGKDFMLDLAQHGLKCEVLILKSSHFRKLNMVGKFMHLHSLNLDFSASLTSFREDCFTCMPNLNFLSLGETGITNMWTTSAALSKLPSLTELRFQVCLCRGDSKECCTPPRERREESNDCVAFSPLTSGILTEATFSSDEEDEQTMNENGVNLSHSVVEDSSDDSEVDFSQYRRGLDELFHLQRQADPHTWDIHDESVLATSPLPMPHIAARKCPTCIRAPICLERYYREYMITTLPKLRCLDNLPIEQIERERANLIFSQHFEYLPYKRRNKESMVSILHKREIRAHRTKVRTPASSLSQGSGISPLYYSRSLSAAKVGSSAWPAVHPLSSLGNVSTDERRNFRPRQFEYHPSDSSLMVFGTLDGEVVVINHESDNIVSYIPSLGLMNSVLGLCWLKNHPAKLIAGSDNGSLRLYDVHHMHSGIRGSCLDAGSVMFDDFDQLTSVHVNSTDELFLASGYSKDVALYDIGSGRCLQVLTDLHQEHINVVKFSNHSPSIFATSSFDQDVKMWDLRQKPNQPCYTTPSSRGNVMVCFSPDDKYLLVSAVDNEVKQLSAVDGRLHLDFNIAPTRSNQNYTRSYYMNGRDYVISGSCDENVVRICCAQTGRRLRDISLEGKGAGASMFVQSLRGDPFRDFNLSVLATYIRPNSNSEIVKVNMLACNNDNEKVRSSSRLSLPEHSSGG